MEHKTYGTFPLGLLGVGWLVGILSKPRERGTCACIIGSLETAPRARERFLRKFLVFFWADS